MVISHPPKDRRAQGPSGSTDWVAASRWVAELRNAKDTEVEKPFGFKVLEWTKGNYGGKVPGAIIKWMDTKEAKDQRGSAGFNYHSKHALLPPPAETAAPAPDAEGDGEPEDDYDIGS